MKIIQIIQKPELRGAGIFACQLANHLQELGHQTFVITLVPGEAKLPYHGQPIYLNRPLRNRFTDLAGWKQLNELVKAIQPDIIQANAADTLKFAVFSKLLFGWKTPVVFRNANKVSAFIDSWPKLILNKFFISQVDHVVSVSEICRLDFMETYSVAARKTSMIPIGVETDQRIGPLSPDLVPWFSANRKVLVNVASFVPEKNHIGLLNIVSRLRARGTDVTVLLIGDGKLRQGIEERIEALDLVGKVHVLGYRNDVLSIVAHANAFILPSNIEGLPGVILEAMLSGTPVIAYDVGGISEVVIPGQTGWLIRAGDEKGFTEAVEGVLNSQNLASVKERAKAMVMDNFDNRQIAERFLEVYKKLT